MSMTGWEGDYPGLESIIDEVEGWHLPATILGTIHLFYLTVGVLSHRTRGAKEMPCGLTSHLRQRLYAIEIVRLMNAPKSPTLHPLPVLPYAISLALSVSYQHLRQSQFEHQQAGARNDFRTCCRILQNLRRTWASADVMATLAKKVLDELDRAPDLAAFRIPRAHKHDTHALENDIIPPPTVCNHGKDSAGDLIAASESFDPKALTTPVAGAGTAAAAGAEMAADGINLFDNMDDLFGTFMDPNYPLNLDDMSWVDDLTPFDWTAEIPGS